LNEQQRGVLIVHDWKKEHETAVGPSRRPYPFKKGGWFLGPTSANGRGEDPQGRKGGYLFFINRMLERL